MMRPLSLPSMRRFTSCSVLALATVLVVGATPAGAQSFLGNGTVTSGTGTITNNVPGSTNVTVTTPQTVIDWVPFDNAIANNTSIAFQNSGTTATFAGSGNYAVLNRINPADSTRNIFMNGTIQAIAAGAAGSANGSIYFYSPGGFVIGANAVINVGSLVLSASPIAVSGGNFISGFGTTNTVVFGQATQAGAAISTNALSQITANGGDAYVAMVAPRVQHGGTINVSGSAALVGAEAATINFSPDGLFDIQVTAGSTDANGVYNDGNITGSAGSPGDIHRAYLVAVPKNAAMTMLITTGSDLGFDVADFADVVGNTVVLSAGHDVVNGSISGVSAGSTGAAIANLDVRDSTFTSAMIGEATGYAHLSGFAALKFYSNVAVHADGDVWLSTQLPGGSVDIDGSLSLSTEQFSGNGEDVASSQAQIFNLNGGSINVDGSTTIDTDAWGGWSGVAGVNGGDATGGNVNVMANNGGSIALLGGLTVSADGHAGGAFDAGVNGGVGTGGQVLLRTAGNASTLTVNNGVTINSSGYGGSGAGGECFVCDGDGGIGQGGDIRIVGQAGTGSTVTITGNVSAVADGFGGSGGVDAAAGNGLGGAAAYFVGNSNVMTLTGNLLLQAEGTGGNSSTADGGVGIGGRADITEVAGDTSGTIIINGNVELSADGEGGDAYGVVGSGGDGVGGDGGDGTYIFAEDASITINGSADLHATGTGGSSTSLAGGFGYGGYSRLVSHNLLTIAGDVDLTALGIGGVGATGGDGFGGIVNARAQLGGELDLQGESNLFSVNATGGFGSDGVGGNAFSTGDLQIYADGVGSTVTISGDTTATSNAEGGNSEDNVGGAAQAGNVDIYAQNSGNVLFDNSLTVRADATGGAGATGGGNADGGTASVFSFASLQVDGALTVSADATGGNLYFTDFSGNSAGDAFGGDVDVYAENGLLTLVGAVTLSTDAVGGEASNSSDFGGDGTGGFTRLFANAGGTVDLQSTLTARAIGTGGGSDYSDGSGIGGNGFGGTGDLGGVRVQATGANATITVAGAATLDASGYGSANRGGNGTGGRIWADSFGAATASLDFLSDVTLNAQGVGGDNNSGTGGDGQGGEALLQASAGSTLTVGGDVIVNTDAFGGYSYDFSDGVGGNATGGVSRIQAFAGTGTPGVIAIDGSATISANGVGGASYSFIGGEGGDGTGGTAQLYAGPGTVTIGTVQSAGGATLTADGHGGTASNGTGGDGTGGELAEIAAFGGDLTIEGYASVSASGFGGNGLYGGDGVGSGIPPIGTDPGVGGAHIFAQNGDIVIKGGASVSAVGTGGGGALDNNGYGGDYGGDGGDGTGGWATIHAANSNLGSSSITIVGGSLEGSGYASVDVGGTGGSGGDGSSGNAGGDGGNGGDGTGGTGSITAAAGNGTVTISNALVYSIGQGGAGGDGGNGDGLPGGNGGDGGNGVGGSGTIGTASSNPQSLGVNNGFGDYGSISVDSSAFGGAGGDGNFGSTSGDGGNGGNAVGGAAYLLVRGSRVDFDTATLTADATGGDGGFGDFETSANGNGGNATVGGDGGIGVLVTERFQVSAHRGTLNGGSINGTAIANAGFGDLDGISQTLGGNLVVFRNADGVIDSLDFLVQADGIGAGAVEDAISVSSGDVTVDGEFSFVTSGTLSLFANNGDMHAGILSLSAGDFVFDTANDPAPSPGTYFADSATITTGNNFVTTAHLDIGSNLVIDAPGLIDAANFTIDGDLDLIAQSGGITANNLDVTGAIDLDAFGAIDLNLVQAGFFHADAGTFFTSSDITSDSNIQINAGDDVTLGEVVAGPTVDIDSNKAIRIITDGSVLAGNILSIGGIDITALGSITGGSVTTGDVMFADALGAIVFGNVSAGLVNPQVPTAPFSVGLVSGASVTVGNIDALLSIALVSPGTVTSGNLTTAGDVLGLVDGNMSIGDIDADGRVLLADYSMYTDAGGTIPTNDAFNPDDVFAAALVPTNGSITVGNVLAGSFQAAAGTTLTVGNILADGAIDLSSGGAMTLGIVDAGGSITLDGDAAIVAGDVTAGDFVLANGGSITLGDVDAASLTLTTTTGNIATGDVSAFGDVRLTSGANIVTGSIDSGDDVALIAAGSISTLDIFAYDDVSADAGTTITTDDITGSSIDLLADGDISTGDLLTQEPFFGDFQLVEGASITIHSGEDIDTANIDSLDGVHAHADGGISTGTIDAETFVELFAGGNITAGTINAGSNIDIFSDNGLLDLADLHAGTQIDLESEGSLLFGDVTADDFNFEMGGSVNGGNIDAITHADGHAEGAIVLENITVTGPPSENNFSIGFTSATSITVENVDGFGQVGFATLGDLTTGNLTAGSLVMTLAGGDIVTGSITTDEGGQVYMANASMFETGGGLEEDGDFDESIVLALNPVPTGGSILIDGAVTTGLFQAASEGNFTAHAIDADSLEVYSEATATIDGLWNVPDVTLVSNDINITAIGGIDGGSAGQITLNSINSDGALIGDGLTGSGYALSNAEFGRISGADDITIIAGGYAGAAADMLVGDLTITGPLAGSNVESNSGGVHFITLSESGSELDGTLRVAGDVVVTGFGADNYLAFYTQNFELDAATGLISITSSGDALAGTLELYASRIHIAEGAILDQLAVNPQYAGYREDLNEQAAVQRPDGVIRAANFDIEFGGSDNAGPYTLYVQNMGTTAVPAGFLLNAANIADDGEGDLPPGSIDMAINGQIIGEGGTLTGIAVRDLLVAEFGTDIFVAGSTINGCPLVGACSVAAPPRIDTPTRTDVQLNDNSGLGDGVDGTLSNPPAPLLDTALLGQSGDVDDPVSGAGNPSLYGTPDEGGDVEICDGTKDKKCETGDKGDGK